MEGTKYLAIWEYVKYTLECKINPNWIPSEANRSADCLSRGRVPEWLERRGRERTLTTQYRELLSLSPIKIWKKLLKIY